MRTLFHIYKGIVISNVREQSGKLKECLCIIISIELRQIIANIPLSSSDRNK